MTFIPGPVGTFYRQFGITMATSIVLSGIVALTLTPVLCAMILKPHTGKPKRRGRSPCCCGSSTGPSKESLGATPRFCAGSSPCGSYRWGSSSPLRRASYLVNTKLATGFIPGEDQGMLYGIIQTPPGSTLEYTNSKSQELQAIAKELDEVSSVSSLAGTRF